MMWGRDDNHILQLGLLTLSKGQSEFGGPVTLGGLTTYNLIYSRVMQAGGLYKENIYGIQQTSSTLYYYWKRMCISAIKNISGVSKNLKICN